MIYHIILYFIDVMYILYVFYIHIIYIFKYIYVIYMYMYMYVFSKFCSDNLTPSTFLLFVQLSSSV